MNNILLVDDRQDFADNFTQESNARGLQIIHKKSFAGLKEILPKHQLKIVAVVLDIRCLMRDDQEKEDASFITSALSYLDRNIPGFPRFILTGDDDAFEQIKGLFKDEKVFLKTPGDLEKLYVELNYCVMNSEVLNLKREHIAAFDVFQQGKMNDAAEMLLIKILRNGLSEKRYMEFKGILADIRSLQETIYKSINARNKSVVPDNMFRPNGMIKFNDLMRYLSGGVIPPAAAIDTVYQNPSIYHLSNSLYWISGEYIHEDPNRIYLISDYTIKSLIYNLMELIIWSKIF